MRLARLKIPLSIDLLEDTKIIKQQIREGFPLGKEFYSIWLVEITAREAFADINSWCQDFVVNFPDFGLSLTAIETVLKWSEDGLVDSATVRAVFEYCIQACGSDIFSASELWKRFMEFEIEEHEEFLETPEASDSQQLRKSKERFFKVIERQLSLPLVGNEATLQQLDKLLGDFCTETDLAWIRPDQLSKRVQAAINKRDERLTYEMHLLSDEYAESSNIADRLAAWKTYIDFEIKAKELSRAQRLFERAVMDTVCKQSEELWLRFSVFALCTLKNQRLASSITQRAVKIAPYHVWLRKCQCYAEEGLGGDGWIGRVQTYVTTALSTGLSSASDYLQLLFAYCNAHRRHALECIAKARQGQVSKATLRAVAEQMRGALQETQAFFTTYFATWPEGHLLLCKLTSHMTAAILPELDELAPPLTGDESEAEDEEQMVGEESAAAVVDTVHKVSPPPSSRSLSIAAKKRLASDILLPWEHLALQYPRQFWVWREAVACLNQYDQQAKASGIFRRILSQHRASIASVRHNEPSVSPMDDVLPRDIAAEWLRFEEDAGLELHSLLEVIDKTLDYVLESIQQPSSSTTTVEPAESHTQTSVSSQKTAVRADSKDTDSNKKSKKRSADGSNSQGQQVLSNKRVKFAAEVSTLQEPPVKRVKLISNESDGATGDATEGKVDGVTDEAMTVVEDENATEASVEHPQIQKPLESFSSNSPSSSTSLPKTTVFVSRLAPSVDDAQLQAHFADCGAIVQVRVARDKRSGLSKGNGLIEFADEDGVRQALQRGKSALAGQQIGVSVSKWAIVPLHRDQASTSSSTSASVSRPNYVSTSSTLTSFKPRGLMKPRLAMPPK